MRCSCPFESRYSLTHLQKFSTEIEKLFSAPSIQRALRDPFVARVVLVRGLEGFEFALAVEVALHVSDVRMVAAIALELVEDLQEHPQDKVAAGFVAVRRLAVDVEEDDVGIPAARTASRSRRFVMATAPSTSATG
jgi:hypothetical protein